MMTNVGVIDRALRLVIGFGLIGWTKHYYGPDIAGLTHTIVLLLAAYPVVTGLLRYDPIFAVTGISTCADDM
jgi:hypothetical protein